MTVATATRKLMALESGRGLPWRSAGAITLWLQRYSEFLGAVRENKPDDNSVLENFDGFLQGALFSLQWQRVRQPNPAMDAAFEGLMGYIKRALLSRAAPQRQIQSTVIREWNEKFEKHKLHANVDMLTNSIRRVRDVLTRLDGKPEVASQLSIEEIDDAFLMFDMQRELARALALDPQVLSAFQFLDAKDDNDFSLDAEGKHLLLLELALLLRTSEWASVSEEQLPQIGIVRRLQTLDFREFLKAFPSRRDYGLKLYLSGAKTDFEKAIVQALYNESTFKRELFAASPPPLPPELRAKWVSYADPLEVRRLLGLLNFEPPRAREIASRYFKDATGLQLGQVSGDSSLMEAYGDDVVEVLTRLAVDFDERLIADPLRALAARKGELRARFFSRRPNELNLGRRTGDCTSFRSEHFADSLRWFANTSSQVMTFSMGKHFLAKAHLVLFRDALVVDAFEVNPLAAPGKELHAMITGKFPEIMAMIKQVGVNLRRPVFVSTTTNMGVTAEYLNQLPPAESEILSPSHFDWNREAARDYIARAAKMEIRFEEDSTLLRDWVFFQSIHWAVDPSDRQYEYEDLTSPVNHTRLRGLEHDHETYFRWLDNDDTVLDNDDRIAMKAARASRMADLPSQDPYLGKIEKLVEAYAKVNREFAERLESLKTVLSFEEAEFESSEMAKAIEDDLYDVYKVPDYIRDADDEGMHRTMYYVGNHRLIYLYFFRRIETATPPAPASDSDADARWSVGGLRKL